MLSGSMMISRLPHPPVFDVKTSKSLESLSELRISRIVSIYSWLFCTVLLDQDVQNESLELN